MALLYFTSYILFLFLQIQVSATATCGINFADEAQISQHLKTKRNTIHCNLFNDLNLELKRSMKYVGATRFTSTLAANCLTNNGRTIYGFRLKKKNVILEQLRFIAKFTDTDVSIEKHAFFKTATTDCSLFTKTVIREFLKSETYFFTWMI